MGIKKTLLNIGKMAAGVVTGGASDRVLDIIEGAVSPEAKGEVQQARLDHKVTLHQIDAERDKAVAEAAASIIVAEAQSDNWMAKTARPGAIWAVTLLIFFNYLIPLVTNHVIRIIALSQVPLSQFDDEKLPILHPEEIPVALFGVWATCLGGYIWSRRAEKRDKLKVENGLDL